MAERDGVAWLEALSPWPDRRLRARAHARAARRARRPRSAGSPRCTSSARTASRRRRGWSRRCSSRDGAARRRVPLAPRPLVGRADPRRRGGGRPRGCARRRSARGRAARRDPVRGADRGRARRVRVRPASTRRPSRRGSAAGTTRRTSSTTRVVVLTNVSLEHTEVLGTTREAIAAEKLAVVRPGCTVVLGEPEWEAAAVLAGAGRSWSPTAGRRRSRPRRRGVPRRAGRRVGARRRLAPRPARAASRRDPGRRPQPRGRRAGSSSGSGRGEYTVVASILGDKDVDAMLEPLAALGRPLRRDALVERPRALRRRARRPRAPLVRDRRGARRPERGAGPSPTGSASRCS